MAFEISPQKFPWIHGGAILIAVLGIAGCFVLLKFGLPPLIGIGVMVLGVVGMLLSWIFRRRDGSTCADSRKSSSAKLPPLKYQQFLAEEAARKAAASDDPPIQPPCQFNLAGTTSTNDVAGQ